MTQLRLYYELTTTLSSAGFIYFWKLQTFYRPSSETQSLRLSENGHSVSAIVGKTRDISANYNVGYFLLQSIIVYTVGIKLALSMTGDDLTAYSRATGVAFIVSLLVTAVASEVFYWLIDMPSQKVGRFLFEWIRE